MPRVVPAIAGATNRAASEGPPPFALTYIHPLSLQSLLSRTHGPCMPTHECKQVRACARKQENSPSKRHKARARRHARQGLARMRAQAQKARHGAHGGVARASARPPKYFTRFQVSGSPVPLLLSIVCLIGSKRGAPLSRGPGACANHKQRQHPATPGNSGAQLTRVKGYSCPSLEVLGGMCGGCTY